MTPSDAKCHNCGHAHIVPKREDLYCTRCMGYVPCNNSCWSWIPSTGYVSTSRNIGR